MQNRILAKKLILAGHSDLAKEVLSWRRDYASIEINIDFDNLYRHWGFDPEGDCYIDTEKFENVIIKKFDKEYGDKYSQIAISVRDDSFNRKKFVGKDDIYLLTFDDDRNYGDDDYVADASTAVEEVFESFLKQKNNDFMICEESPSK